VPQGPVRTVLVVVPLPSCELRPGVVKRQELLEVEKFVAEPAVEGLDVPVVGGFPRSGEVERDAPRIGPRFERFGRAVSSGPCIALERFFF
jgi:hypothetical protein